MIQKDGESWFKIDQVDRMRAFFMNIVSDSNHWMFISSNGGLSAGRRNSKYALFPYYTDDKITDSAEITGSKTIIRVNDSTGTHTWEPFSDRDTGKFHITRSLYKNFHGNKILFEEYNQDLKLVFRYQWNSSNTFGFVRKAEVCNISDQSKTILVLDGVQNLMPAGVDPDMQTRTSNLADAYKRSELIRETGLGIYALSAIIVDKAEPSESLTANIVWSLGLKARLHLLSSIQLHKFRKGEALTEELDVKGERGAYFIVADIELGPNSSHSWKLIANVNQNQAQVVALNHRIKKESDALAQEIEHDIKSGTGNLVQLVASADGIRHSADEKKDVRHYSNVLFNIMRGGIFDNGYNIDKKDFLKYLRNASKPVYAKNEPILVDLPDVFTKNELARTLIKTGDADLIRLGTEYLPLKFSRRHGDPSRPWNQFSINTHDELDGSKILDYEGNWRDIFQNWEALVHAYPDYIDSMIYKFLNASTFDGYNPYRVTKGGFDWETIEPDNPWSYIGYWGDHQIIYLLKFLEFYHMHRPDAFRSLFGSNVFAYANVPYQIKPYHEILVDPKNTIEFDEESDLKIRSRVREFGADGALLTNNSGSLHRVNFIEKLLATMLAKVSNFIPEGGIWMNTQRPEWNDANNALVGNGVSMVTLYYLYRFVTFLRNVLAENGLSELRISSELKTLFIDIQRVLSDHAHLLSGPIDDMNRKKITDALGLAGSAYRTHIYDHGFSGDMVDIRTVDVVKLLDTTIRFLEHSIQANRRPDALYHSYNIVRISNDTMSIHPLSEMLEGQVAALSSGYVSSASAVDLLDALRQSTLYRVDQNSYMLYPDKELPGFMQKNNIPVEYVQKSGLLQKLIADGNLQLIIPDIEGGYHFNGTFRNATDVKSAMEVLRSSGYSDLVESESGYVLQIFENVFNHEAFTGRSGTFYAYEGLCSIYWHMVSKLHLAVTEITVKAIRDGEDADLINRLTRHFRQIGDGIGVHKSPEAYGAFPTDPYSHTPKHRGAQQPGMTGQVKEDILVSIGELGVRVEDGLLRFEPGLLSQQEFFPEAREVRFIDVHNRTQEIRLPEHSLCFTICQVPVIYTIRSKSGIEVTLRNGTTTLFDQNRLDRKTTRSIFDRAGEVEAIRVGLTADRLSKI